MSQSFEVAEGTIGELFWNVSDAVLVGRTDGLMAWNPGAEAMLGMTGAEATSDDSNLTRVFGTATDQFWELVEVGQGKARLECGGGSERILEATAWRLGGDRSAPTVMMLHDVTAEERRLTGLSRLNSLARQLLEEQPIEALSVPIVDTAKELTAADFSALILLRPGSEVEIAHFSYNAPRELFPERLPRAVGLLAEPIRTRSVARIRDIRGHSQGVGIPVEHPPVAALLAVPILMGDQVLGELAVANSPKSGDFDETDEALMRELAAHAAHAVTLATVRQAHHEEEEKRRALLDVSLHDIRTPLTVARGFVSTIRSYGDELSEEDRESSFDSIEQALDRIQSLAEGPLLGKPDETGGAFPRPVEVVDVNELMAELMAELGEYRQDVSLEAKVEPDWSATFVGDRVLARELLDNLVTNAIKHSAPGDVVSVTARCEGESVRFDVTDRGPGIPSAEQGRVFEKGYRTAESVAAGIAGTGQGLAIARKLAELQGGVVGLSSRSGQGTTFWATLPFQRDVTTSTAG